MVHNLGVTNSILNNFVLEIRDEVIQKDALRFRRNLERIGEIIILKILVDVLAFLLDMRAACLPTPPSYPPSGSKKRPMAWSCARPPRRKKATACWITWAAYLDKLRLEGEGVHFAACLPARHFFQRNLQNNFIQFQKKI